MNRKNSGDWSLFFDAEIDELEIFEDMKEYAGHGKVQRQKRDSGVRRHRKGKLKDKWSGEEN